METFLATSLGKYCFLSFCENCLSLDQSLIYFFTIISYWESQPKTDEWGALTHCLSEVPIIVADGKTVDHREFLTELFLAMIKDAISLKLNELIMSQW